MSAYISVVFEKARLVTSGQVRVIVRNRDDGSVPPLPNVSYYPTHPNDLQDFIVGQYLNNVSGDAFARIATLTDISTLTVRPLNVFRDLSVDFLAASVAAGDLLQVQLIDPELWTSVEYTDTNPHIFQIQSVINATTITLTKPFPAYLYGASWSIPARNLTSATGFTQREGLPSNGTYFLDSRYNRLYSNVVDSENSVIAMKADILALTDESAGAGLTTEVITVSSSI